jgi:hypothetical protein
MNCLIIAGNLALSYRLMLAGNLATAYRQTYAGNFGNQKSLKQKQ